jgi:DNA repair exonuclease SbcCD nuclease subunit
MAKLIALASADFHIHQWRSFNENGERLQNCIRVLRVISDRCHKKGVPFLFAGDWYHTPDSVENYTHAQAMSYYKIYFEDRKIETYAISGNHDLSQRNGIAQASPTHLSAYANVFKTFYLMDNTLAHLNKRIILYGMAYWNSDKELASNIQRVSEDIKRVSADMKILMIHTDLPGAVTPEGHEVKETEHITYDLFKEWDLVIAGHIHKPQLIKNKFLMCGSPIHQNLGDEGTKMGYWEIYDDASVKFVHLKDFPEFKRGEYKDDGNYWVEPEVVLAEQVENYGEFHISKSRKKLGYLYCKRKGIKSKQRMRALIHILNQAE